MRKLLFLLVLTSATLFQTSCSKDDAPAEEQVPVFVSTITATIDGTVKTFNNVVVTKTVINAGTSTEYTELKVRGQIGTNASEYIILELEKGDLGSTAIYDATYAPGGQAIYFDGDDFISNVTTNNTSNSLVGTFSGQMSNFNAGTAVTITNGTFNIRY